MSNVWFQKQEKRKVIFRMGENETEVDFVMIKKEHQWFIQNIKAIPGEFQHAFAIADIDVSKIRKVVRMTCAEITLLKDVKIGKRFEEKVTALVDVGASHLVGHFKDGVL